MNGISFFFDRWLPVSRFKSKRTSAVSSVAEISIILAYAFCLVWLIAPANKIFLLISSVICVVVFTLVSHRLHGETRFTIGIRLDNIASSLKQHAVFTSLSLLAILIAGFIVNDLRWDEISILEVMAYFLWACFQQYFFQSVFTSRLKDLLGNRHQLAFVNALLFSAIHIPNPFLIITTFICGYFWTCFFQRHPNLFILAANHAVLAMAIHHALPGTITHGMRVGPMFYH